MSDTPGSERLTQPRPLALLAYLVLARPPGPHSRDILVSLLWPEADHATGRQGLRNALHRIRTALSADLIVTSGEALVGVDQSQIVCDGLEFQQALNDQRWERAVSLYTGELLQGFHVGGAPDFEHWLDAERNRLGDAAVAAARSVALASRAAGDMSAALSAARTAYDLAPYDERSVRELLELMTAAGDRAAALRTYEDFVKRIARDLDAEPSAETQAAIRAIRGGNVGSFVATSAVSQLPPAPVPKTSPHASFAGPLASASEERTRRPRLLAAALVSIALAAVWLVLSPRVAQQPVPQPVAALDPSAASLAERWRSDTTHLAAYLTARAQLSEASVPDARVSFEKLVMDAPLFAPGWAGLSVALYRSGFQDVPPRQAMPQALAAANRALALDPDLPDATETLIAYDLFYRWDLASAKRRLDSAMARHPDYPEFYNLLATWHRFRDELDVSLDIKEDNAERDPLSPRYQYQVAQSLYFAHRCDEATAAYRRIPVELRPPRSQPIFYQALVCAGKLDEAAAALRDAELEAGDTLTARLLDPPLSPEKRAQAVEAVFRRRLERQLAKRQKGWSPPEDMMLQYAGLQNADSTLIWLDSMYVERSMMLFVVPFDPLNDFLRDDPRFQAFVERLPWREPTSVTDRRARAEPLGGSPPPG